MMASVVYFITCDGLIKIGSTRNLEERLSTIRAQRAGSTIDVIGIIPGSFKIERAIHREFEAFRIGGEWFDDDALLRSAIADLIAKRGIMGVAGVMACNSPKPRNKIATIEDQAFVENAVDVVASAVELALPKCGRDYRKAISLVASEIGVSDGIIWSLRYRPPKSITAATNAAIERYASCHRDKSTVGRAADAVDGAED